MAITQNRSVHGDTDKSHNFDIATAIQEQRVNIHTSEFMGCHYIFVTPLNTKELFAGEHLGENIQALVNFLDTNPQQTVLVLINNQSSHRFTRLEPVWEDRQVVHVNALTIDTPDQIEFMEMMLDCSTLY